MLTAFIVVSSACVAVFAMGFSLGRTWLTLRTRVEENRRRELELMIFDKRCSVIRESKELSGNLDELLYRVSIQKEIGELTDKPGEV